MGRNTLGQRPDQRQQFLLDHFGRDGTDVLQEVMQPLTADFAVAENFCEQPGANGFAWMNGHYGCFSIGMARKRWLPLTLVT